MTVSEALGALRIPEVTRKLQAMVIVIEHNMGIVANAYWIIDMGPEGGHRGGEVIFEGTPRELLKAKQSLTGEYLAAETR
jgi:excinuclease UvrABC ATPase subunit